MKKIKFIPLLFGFLVSWNLESSFFDNTCNEKDFYAEYFEDLNKIKKDGENYGLKFNNEVQKKEFQQKTGKNSFLIASKLDNVKKVDLCDCFVSYAKNILEKDSSEVFLDEEFVENKSYDIRKMLLFDILLDYNVMFDIMVPRIFLASIYDDRCKQSLYDIFGKRNTKEIEDILDVIIDYFCVNKFFKFLLDGDLECDINANVKISSHAKNNNIEGNKSIYEEVKEKQMVLCMKLSTENDLDVVDNNFVKYCTNRFEEKTKNLGANEIGINGNNLRTEWISILKSYAGNIFVGLSNMYVYFYVPNDYFDEVKSLIANIKIQKEFQKGFINGCIALCMSKIMEYISLY